MGQTKTPVSKVKMALMWLIPLERKADAGGTTLLGGVTHVILHVRLPDGSERQLRFHTEGCWTMAAKGRAMDELEQRIVQWHGR
jgi:hypothetical protein